MFTSIHTERLFAHIGSNTRILTASKASEATTTQRTMATVLGVSCNLWTAGDSETSHECSDFAALPAMHDMHDTHGAHDVEDVSFTDHIDQGERIRFSSRFKTSTTGGFQPTEHRTTEYVTNQMKVIHNGPRLLSDQPINWIKATEDIQLEITNTNRSEALNKQRNLPIFATSTRAWLLLLRAWRLLSPSTTAQAGSYQLLSKTLRRWRKSSRSRIITPPSWRDG